MIPVDRELSTALGAGEHQMTVERELRTPVATAQLVHFDFRGPVDNLLRESSCYRLDLCLTPRPANARAWYPGHFRTRRFERIGNLFMVPPGEVVQAVSDGCCRQASIVCELHPGQFGACFDDDGAWTDSSLLAGLDIRERPIQALLQRLAEEARNPGFASETMVELISAQLAIELTRYRMRSATPFPSRGLAAWRLRLIDERLREVREPPSLSDLAALCGLSIRQLTRGFRSSRGCSIGDYLAANRVDQAKRLLGGERSIKAIAYTLGFSSPSSFSYAFRRASGKSPTQFRHDLHRLH